MINMEIRFQKVTIFFSKKGIKKFPLNHTIFLCSSLEYFAVKSQEMAIPDF